MAEPFSPLPAARSINSRLDTDSDRGVNAQQHHDQRARQRVRMDVQTEPQ